MLDFEELKKIKLVARFGRNGRKYIWKNIDYCKTLKLARKYGIDQICNGVLWLQS